jgi:prevent-host-death family protein
LPEPIRVSVSEARIRLPELLRFIERGGTVIVSRHGLPISLMSSAEEIHSDEPTRTEPILTLENPEDE